MKKKSVVKSPTDALKKKIGVLKNQNGKLRRDVKELRNLITSYQLLLNIANNAWDRARLPEQLDDTLNI